MELLYTYMQCMYIGLLKFACQLNIQYTHTHMYTHTTHTLTHTHTHTASLMLLLQRLGSAYHSLSTYNLEQAIQEFETIPPHHYSTAWVTCQVARAYFTGEKYKQVSGMFGLTSMYCTQSAKFPGNTLFSVKHISYAY